MSQRTQLSRYRPAVIAITGLAAAYGVYIIYTTLSPRPAKHTLHRSNAVHRARRAVPEVAFVKPTDGHDDRPLGMLVFSRSGRNIGSMLLGRDKLASAEDLHEQFGCDGESFRAIIAKMATWGVLVACCIAALPEHGVVNDAITALGLGSLADVITAVDMDGVAFRAHQDAISGIIGGVDLQIVRDGVETFRELYFNQVHTNASLLPENPDVFEIAETDESMAGGPDADPSQGLKGLLYHIAEESAKRGAYEHRGIKCSECSEGPIRNIRWHCLNCPNYELCSACEAGTDHSKTHVFAKIKIPLPVLSQPSKPHPIWYPGDPTRQDRPFNAALRTRLAEHYPFDGPELDALYDQFTCIANVLHEQDANRIEAGIDRRAFDKALTSDSWTNRFAPNALYDRMFAFYDTTDKGLIGFEDFVSGIAYLRGPKRSRYEPLSRALRGYDVNGDGFVDRGDCLRLLRAKYAIQKRLTLDVSKGQESVHTHEHMDVIRSSQPISSIFRSEQIPQGETRLPNGKWINAYGDMEAGPNIDTVLDVNADDDGIDGGQPLLDGTDARPRLRARGGLGEDIEHNENADLERSVRSADRLTPEEAQILGLTRSEARRGTGVPVEKDVLWRIVDASFDNMLDSIFKAVEDRHKEIRSTREERQSWRVAIGELLEKKRLFREDLQHGAAVDPLMATAARSFDQASRTPPVLPTMGSYMRQNMMPTDSPALERLETDIFNQPLGELLSASGYAVAEPSQQIEPPLMIHTEVTHPAPPNGISRARVTISQGPTGEAVRADPTSTQNRPNRAASTHAEPSSEPAILSPDERIDEHFRALGFGRADLLEMLGQASVIEHVSPDGWALWTREHLQHSPGHWRAFYLNVVQPLYAQPRVNLETSCQQSDGNHVDSVVGPSDRPDQDRLECLAKMEEEEISCVKARGGPGRLSYDEIENNLGRLSPDGALQLRGLLTSWLEYASF